MKKILCIVLSCIICLSAVCALAENNILSRIEAVRLISEAIGYNETTYDCPFADVNDEDKNVVGYAFEKGLVKGTGNDLFMPDASITRECFLTMVLRSLKYTDPVSFSWDNPYDRAFITGIYPERREGDFTIEEAKDILEKRKSANYIYSSAKENGSYWENLSYVSSQTTKLDYLFDLEDCTIITGYITGTPHGAAPKGSVVYKADGQILHLTLPRINPWKSAPAENVCLSEDNTKLCYVCTVESDYVGMDGVTVLQEAGVFEYTVDLVTKETTVEVIEKN